MANGETAKDVVSKDKPVKVTRFSATTGSYSLMAGWLLLAGRSSVFLRKQSLRRDELGRRRLQLDRL